MEMDAGTIDGLVAATGLAHSVIIIADEWFP